MAQSPLMLKIQSFTTSDGRQLQPSELTIFVGPNNGGKSRLLSDLASAIINPAAPRLAARDVELRTAEGWQDLLGKFVSGRPSDAQGQVRVDGLEPDMVAARQAGLALTTIADWLNPGNAADEDTFAGWILPHIGFRLLSHLRTETRLQLAARQTEPKAEIQGARSVVHALFEAPDAARWIEQKVQQAFDKHVALDSQAFALGFVLSPTADLSDHHIDRRQATAKLPKVEEQGDGIRAFVGLLAAVGATTRPIVLVDEPEAFLHPPQAYRVGAALAEQAAEGRQIFVATHSADVLRGILSVSADVQVLRTAQINDTFATKLLDATQLQAIASHPVLSSSRVLEGLFYDAVAITESDGDLVVYRRAMEQLGTRTSFHFVNSYGKQASAALAVPFRHMDVPYCAIVDFDALRERAEFERMFSAFGGNWAVVSADYDNLIQEMVSGDDPAQRLKDTKQRLAAEIVLLDAATDPAAALTIVRRRLSETREHASLWSEYKRLGRDKLNEAGKAAFDRIDRRCRELGLFIVPVGELEAWLPTLVPYSKNKAKWTTDALAALQQPLAIGEKLRHFVQDIDQACSVRPAPPAAQGGDATVPAPHL